MTVWTGDAVATALGTGPVATPSFSEISTDTRSMRPGALFVALTGDRFNGHQFLETAAHAGAHAAVVRRGTRPVDGLELIDVDDPLAALGTLANARRKEIVGPVVGVTGTNGKTSTKEMLAAVLGVRWKVHATAANLNNLVGVPQTILAAPANTEALVVEAGANERGEMARLRDIVEPTLAVVTNVSPGHLEGFGSLDLAMVEKMSFLRDVDVAVVGTHPPELKDAARSSAGRVVSAGLGPDADLAPDDWKLRDDGTVGLTFKGQAIDLPLVGRHQAENAALVLAVASVLELELSDVADALATVALPKGRCELMRCGELLILNDTYNANPDSLKASLDAAEGMRAGRSLVVVVGSMLELGDDSPRLHREAAEAIERVKPALIGATGEFTEAFETSNVSGDRLIVSESVEALGRAVRARLQGDELVLLKASRGVRLERIIPLIATEEGN